MYRKALSPAAFRPIVLAAIVGRRELLQFSGPEPTVDVQRLQIRPVATLKVAQTTGRPDVLHLVCRKRAFFVNIGRAITVRKLLE